MALSLPFVVRIEKKPERSFGATMNDIRTWLDHRGIEPVSFHRIPVIFATLFVRERYDFRSKPFIFQQANGAFGYGVAVV